MAKYYTVFNMAQCDGLTAPDEQTTFEHAPIKRAENIVNNMPNRPEIKTGNQASYRPLADIVTMPAKNTFTSPEGYYATLYHELGHRAHYTPAALTANIRITPKKNWLQN